MEGESGELRVRRCGRSMNRQVRDRGTGMRLTERTRKLIPETWWGIFEPGLAGCPFHYLPLYERTFRGINDIFTGRLPFGRQITEGNA